MRRYLLHNLVAIDQLGNTLLGGYPDETISARAWRADQSGRVLGRIFRPAIDFVFLALFRERDHCRLAFLSEVTRRQFPGAYGAHK